MGPPNAQPNQHIKLLLLAIHLSPAQNFPKGEKYFISELSFYPPCLSTP